MRVLAAILSCAALLAAGCASAPVTPPAAPATAPTILGVTVAKGRGVPFGRSDSGEDYLRLEQKATDPGYGYTQQNPVRVGGPLREGPRREKAYLNGLRGPAGEVIEYERMGSCCPFESPNDIMGGGMLDAFRVTYAGQAAPATLYINFYDPGPALVPLGFSARAAGR
ncbi:hypothetical protein D0B54_10125 [Solimonas sp. K1W22B-7]|uniref:hypothetical protein n=1 Tax=Solimonas sp. K1W22B-7 TaxID=2303331 RepID=UPI000E333C58|nr:hypothetical protein [Solimonas sp. K1W22B-7]AXQ29022.1 hypothetical protein D0B54_10125 [Solimonas sp. K1W22B-7]